MNLKKILKVLGIIILVVILLLVIHTIRNFIIVQGLQGNIAKYINSTNYHIKSFTKEQSGVEMNVDFYVKDGKNVSFIKRNMNGDISKITTFSQNDKNGFNTYIENGVSKIAMLEKDGLSIREEIYNGVESDSRWHTVISSFFAHIRSEKVNGKDCYVVENFPSYINLASTGKIEYYIEKDTGLMIKSVTNDIISEREYEFNNVDDSIFLEPDISQYVVKEN